MYVLGIELRFKSVSLHSFPVHSVADPKIWTHTQILRFHVIELRRLGLRIEVLAPHVLGLILPILLHLSLIGLPIQLCLPGQRPCVSENVPQVGTDPGRGVLMSPDWKDHFGEWA